MKSTIDDKIYQELNNQIIIENNDIEKNIETNENEWEDIDENTDEDTDEEDKDDKDDEEDKDDIEKDDIKKEDIKKENELEEEQSYINKKDINNGDINNEDINNGDINNGDINNEDINNGDINNGDINNEDINNEDMVNRKIIENKKLNTKAKKVETISLIDFFLTRSKVSSRGSKNKKNSTDSIFYDILSEEEENYIKKINKTKLTEYKQQYIYLKNLDTNNIPLRFQILDSKMPEFIKCKVINKYDEIQDIPPIGGERNKWNQWITGILKVPFGEYKEYPFDINNSIEISKFLEKAKLSLDNSVYGHDECKDFIIQMISQFISNKNSQGNVIGVQGPPGNGKTSLIRDGVCKSLDRPFSMISLGGLSDGSHLEGHNFTYEGSMWGRLVQILMDAKCMNPVIYFDELDKVSNTKHGEEIIGILTHLTDFSQNDEIYDKYFSGIPFDFSKCMFIFSFNDETKINPILKDRIHIIKTDKIDNDGKLIIAKNYLIKKLLLNVGLNENDIIFTNEILKEILNNYTYKEEGVREFKRKLEMIILKFNYYRLIKPDIYKIPYTIDTTFINETLNTLTHKKITENFYINNNIYI